LATNYGRGILSIRGNLMEKPVRRTRIFRRLQWRLTLSYTLVTVAALVVVELVLIGLLLVLLNSEFLTQEIVGTIREDLVPQASGYLDRTPPDTEGLGNWLRSIVDDSVASGQGSRRLTRGLSIQFDQNYQLFVIGSSGQLLAQVSDEHSSSSQGDAFDPTGIPGLPPLLSAVYSGEQELDLLYTTLPDGTLVMALPVENLEGELLGAFVVTMILPAFNLQTLGSAAILIGLSVIPFTLAAGLLGTAFGFLTARGLTRRIESLSTTADSWSRGDFSATNADSSADELGQLSRRLNLMAEQLQNLLQTNQELAGIEERYRLARELHDSVKQQVFATTMQIAAARSSMTGDSIAALQHLKEAEKLSRQSQEELALLIQELRPAALEADSLAKALDSYLTDWSSQTGIKTRFKVDAERQLPNHIEQTLFRVFQETLSNVARHSDAHSVEVELVFQSGEVTLSVLDDGQGFNLSTASRKGYGLQSMKERIDSIGGKLSVDTSPGKGTQVIATILTDEVVT
jgi:NarL family two-component system sensor histidine kinase LiaS